MSAENEFNKEYRELAFKIHQMTSALMDGKHHQVVVNGLIASFTLMLISLFESSELPEEEIPIMLDRIMDSVKNNFHAMR